jgi:DNA-binding LacI/PurR family transcriptional regulator
LLPRWREFSVEPFQMGGKITLQEIAVAARVSVATASRALNGTGQVSPDVAKRVLAAAAKLHVKPPYAGKNQTICFLLANRSMLHPFHAHVLMGSQEFAIEHQNHVLFYPFHYRANVPLDEIELPLLVDRRGSVDGFIVGGMNSKNLLELLTRIGVPFAVLGNNVWGPWDPSQYDVVWMDDLTGAYEMTQYLQELGHKQIWFLGSRRFPTSRIHKGYTRAMKEAGLTPHTMESDSEDEREAGYVAAKSLFAKRAKITAIFAYNDAVAHGAIEAARACGLKIPEDITVAGFGNRPEAAALTPALTTVWAYPDQVGRRLSELLLSRIANPGGPPQQVVLPTRLIERSSCARAATSEAIARKLERFNVSAESFSS